jgi:hypothetical protein
MTNKNVCPHFMRKSGGYYYGFKCDLYHNGNFDIYSDGTRIEFDRLYSDGKYHKEQRDQYVDGLCKGDYQSCSLYKSSNKTSP